MCCVVIFRGEAKKGDSCEEHVVDGNRTEIQDPVGQIDSGGGTENLVFCFYCYFT